MANTGIPMEPSPMGHRTSAPILSPDPGSSGPGAWICYEAMLKLNTPGSRDGRLAVWQNGTLIADWQNLRFRDVSTLKINKIMLEHGGKKLEPAE